MRSLTDLRLLTHDLGDPDPVDHLLLRHLQQRLVRRVICRGRQRVRVPPPRQRPMVPVVPVQQRGLDLQQKSSTLVLLLLQCHDAR